MQNFIKKTLTDEELYQTEFLKIPDELYTVLAIWWI